jgi:hypothetical protein
MTFRELAKSLGLFVTNNDVVYFDKYEMVSDFIWEANRVGIKTQVHQHPDSGKVTYAVVEAKDDRRTDS